MMQRAGQAAGNTREPFTFYLAVAGLYLAITSVSVWAPGPRGADLGAA